MSGSVTLARRIEHSDARGACDAVAAMASLRPEHGATFEAMAGGFAVYGGVGSPLSRARALGMQGPVSEDELIRLESFYQVRGLPTRFELCPYADPSLFAIVGQRGYRVTGFANVFVLDPAAVPDTRSPPRDLRVRQVDSSDALGWSRLIGQGFGEPEPSLMTIEIGLAQFGRPDVACFQAELGGMPIGGGVVGFDLGAGFLFAGSTHPDHRGHGAQTALIAARVAHARAHGCDLVSVVSSAGSGSQRNIERAGFRVLYTRVSMERAA